MGKEHFANGAGKTGDPHARKKKLGLPPTSHHIQNLTQNGSTS